MAIFTPKVFAIALGVVSTGTVAVIAPAAYDYFTSKHRKDANDTALVSVPNDQGNSVGQGESQQQPSPQQNSTEGGQSQSSDSTATEANTGASGSNPSSTDGNTSGGSSGSENG